MAEEIKINNKVKEIAREYAIDILQKQVKELTDRVEKLEAQFTWPTSLSSDWNYVKDHPWLDYNDTSLSKRPNNYVRYEDLSTWSNND